jgi:hypothetical protein
VQQQYKETKEILVQEREAAKKAAEIAPVIKEVPVVDTELMNKLRDENDKLKVRELNTMWIPPTYTTLTSVCISFSTSAII